MTRLEKCILAKKMGYTYNPTTGIIYGITGKQLTTKNNGYVEIAGSKQCRLRLLGQMFAWYWVYGNLDVEVIDHINKIKDDNRITNLRSLSTQQNAFNTNAKGYTWDKTCNKWRAQLALNGKHICLGRYNTIEEAKKAYIKGKEKYHKL
jgi:hypothetical protein